MPKVINRRIDRLTPFDETAVYVGRGSAYGNPFKIGEDGTRDEVIRMYKLWINEKSQSKLRAKIRRELRGKDLICWCAPEACHADLLLEWANRKEPS